MVAELAALIATLAAGVGEWLHARRRRRVARLAYGPGERPRPWVLAEPVLRIAASAALAWGLTTLCLLAPKVHTAEVDPDAEPRHLVIVLDVSPSMRLQDAGVEKDQSRQRRAAAVLESLFERVPLGEYRLSVVAVYTSAKRVVEDTRDLEVIRNILNDLPMHYAFKRGKTKLFDGLEEAARLAQPWNPYSAAVLVISDGDTVPATGMPRMPVSVRDVLVVGIGDPTTGSFIDGRQSRQDASTLRQIAVRLQGNYHNANVQHIPSDLIKALARPIGSEEDLLLSRREYALLATVLGALILALLPWLLNVAGTAWRPGSPRRRVPKPGRSRAGLLTSG